MINATDPITMVFSHPVKRNCMGLKRIHGTSKGVNAIANLIIKSAPMSSSASKPAASKNMRIEPIQ